MCVSWTLIVDGVPLKNGQCEKSVLWSMVSENQEATQHVSGYFQTLVESAALHVCKMVTEFWK